MNSIVLRPGFAELHIRLAKNNPGKNMNQGAASGKKTKKKTGRWVRAGCAP